MRTCIHAALMLLELLLGNRCCLGCSFFLVYISAIALILILLLES